MPTIKYVDPAGDRVRGTTTIISDNLGWGKGALMYWSWKEGIEGRDYKKSRDKAADAGTMAHYLIECDVKGMEPRLGLDSPLGPALPDEVIEKGHKAFGEYLRWKKMVSFSVHSSEPNIVVPVFYCDVCGWEDTDPNDPDLRETALLHSTDSSLFDPHPLMFCPGCGEELSVQYYGLTPDVIATIGKALTLFDWKTSNAVYPSMLLQLVAYRFGWERKFPKFPLVGGYHLLKISKESAHFTHHSWAELPPIIWEDFLSLLRLERHQKAYKKLL